MWSDGRQLSEQNYEFIFYVWARISRRRKNDDKLFCLRGNFYVLLVKMSLGTRQYRYSYTPPELEDELEQDRDRDTDTDSALVINVRSVRQTGGLVGWASDQSYSGVQHCLVGPHGVTNCMDWSSQVWVLSSPSSGWVLTNNIVIILARPANYSGWIIMSQIWVRNYLVC